MNQSKQDRPAEAVSSAYAARIKHGKRATYVSSGCKCDPCTEANRVHAANRRRQMAMGKWSPFVDASLLKPYLRHINDQTTVTQLSRAAGVSVSTLRRILGDSPFNRILVRRATAERILKWSAKCDPVADPAIITPTPRTS